MNPMDRIKVMGTEGDLKAGIGNKREQANENQGQKKRSSSHPRIPSYVHGMCVCVCARMCTSTILTPETPISNTIHPSSQPFCICRCEKNIPSDLVYVEGILLLLLLLLLSTTRSRAIIVFLECTVKVVPYIRGIVKPFADSVDLLQIAMQLIQIAK